MISSILAFSLILSATSLGDEVEFSRPSLELYEEFLLTRHSPHYIFKFEDIRERARNLSVDELHAIRDDVIAIFSHDLTGGHTPSDNRRYLAHQLLSRVLACGLYEKDYDTLMDFYDRLNEDLIDIASKPATTPNENERGLIVTTNMFYKNFLSEMIHSFITKQNRNEKLLELVMENIDVPSAVVRGVALIGLRDFIKEIGEDSVDREEVAKALSRVKEIEYTIQGIDFSALQEWPLQLLESPYNARANLRFIQQIEELLEQ